MNIVLFEKKEINKALPLSDKRGNHIIKILKFKENDIFDAGIIGGEKGKAYITEITDTDIHFSFKADYIQKEVIKQPLILVTAFARPPEAKKILKNITTLGVNSICFIRTLNSERSYMDSSLWKNDNYREYLIDGACQAFATDIPDIYLFPSLLQCINSPVIKSKRERIALDNYESTVSLTDYEYSSADEISVLAVGGERGWSSKEREILRENSFTLCSLGERVLKTETACTAGITLIKSKKGII